jgi:hypothetical protein
MPEIFCEDCESWFEIDSPAQDGIPCPEYGLDQTVIFEDDGAAQAAREAV